MVSQSRPLQNDFFRVHNRQIVLFGGRTSGCLKGKNINFCLTFPHAYLKKSDFTQINFEVLISFNNGLEKYANYACADAKQLHLIEQVRYHETIVKNNGSGFSSSDHVLIYYSN